MERNKKETTEEGEGERMEGRKGEKEESRGKDCILFPFSLLNLFLDLEFQINLKKNLQ